MIDRLVGKKVIGIKQSKRAMEHGQGIALYVAKDAEMKLIEKLLIIAEEKSVEIIKVDTMQKLGKMCGIDVHSAAALLLE